MSGVTRIFQNNICVTVMQNKQCYRYSCKFSVLRGFSRFMGHSLLTNSGASQRYEMPVVSKHLDPLATIDLFICRYFGLRASNMIETRSSGVSNSL